MGFLMLGGCVVPTLIDPSSQFFMLPNGISTRCKPNSLMIFLCSSAYEKAKPTTTGKSQWCCLS